MMILVCKIFRLNEEYNFLTVSFFALCLDILFSPEITNNVFLF